MVDSNLRIATIVTILEMTVGLTAASKDVVKAV